MRINTSYVRNVCIKYIISIGFVAFTNFLHAQNNDKLKAEWLVVRQHLSGAIWTTVMNEGTILTDAVGYKNNQTKELLSSTDKVLVGSVAKTILSAGFLRMATIGPINLNDPVNTFLSYQLKINGKNQFCYN